MNDFDGNAFAFIEAYDLSVTHLEREKKVRWEFFMVHFEKKSLKSEFSSLLSPFGAEQFCIAC